MNALFRTKCVLRKGIKAFAGWIPFILMLLWFLPVATITWGCVTAKPHSSTEKLGLYVEILLSSRVELSNINVKQAENKLAISGEVSRRNAAFSGIGHIDVAVISPAGSVIGLGHGDYWPRILPKTPGARKHRPSRFELSMHCNPPWGSTVRIAYHGKFPHSDPSQDFQENYAVPERHDYGR